MAPPSALVGTLLTGLFVLVSLTCSPPAAANFFADPGEYMVQGNPQAAARHLQAAAESGDARAMFALAHLYRTGAGVPRDPVRSTALYLQAAKLGHIDAQYITGICYERGRGVDKDIARARLWFQRASRSGHDDAQTRLAQLDQLPVGEDTEQLGTLIRDGNLSGLEALLNSGASPDARDLMGTPMLHLAVLHQHQEIVEYLIARGADLGATDGNLDTAMHIAAAHEDDASYEILEVAGADPDAANQAGWTAGQLRARHRPSTQTTVADVSSAQRLAGYRQDERFQGWSTLSIAAWAGDTKLTRQLVAQLADQGTSFKADATGYSPLARAVQNSQLETAQLLLDAGADPGDPSSVALVPLAVTHRDDAVLGLLISRNVPLDRLAGDGATALQRAIRAGHSDLAITLIDAGADAGLAGKDGVTPLMLAAGISDTRLTAHIMLSGVDLTLTDPQQRNALHYAAASGCEPAVFDPLATMLPLAPDREGQWPLHLAAASGCVALTQVLLQRGHAVDVLSIAGNTPLSLAAAQGDAETVRLLVSQGADPNRRDEQGETPLHRAVRGNHEAVVSVLVSSGANPSIRNNNALNVFDLTEDPGMLETLNAAKPALFATFE